MAGTTPSVSKTREIVVADLQPPSIPTGLPLLSGPPVSPQLRVFGYESGEWEDFIREWATGLEEDYVQIKRVGGSNDHGVDIAAFKTVGGFQGPWDAYQGKHYADPLMPSDAFAEMFKIFLGVHLGVFILPDTYQFLAPRGCGITLDKLLSTPAKLKIALLAKKDKDDSFLSKLDEESRDAVLCLIDQTDFSMFRSVQLVDAIETHRKTPYFVTRFGGPVPPRGTISPPPEAFATQESRYISQLIDIYREQAPELEIPCDSQGLPSEPTFGAHFQRQRLSFYSAESLRLHARDSVPEGTFEALQDDIHSGVVDLVEATHSSGMDRLAAVLVASTQLQLDGHAALLSISRMDDRKGICHQLANADRVTWVRDAE